MGSAAAQLTSPSFWMWRRVSDWEMSNAAGQHISLIFKSGNCHEE